jgi:predicted nucleotidyltransferase
MDINNFHRKIVKESKYPFVIRATLLTVSSWLFQGLLYMDKSEKLFKIFLDVLILTILYASISRYLNPLNSLLISIISAHTVNWIFNGHIYVLIKNLGLTQNRYRDFSKFLEEISSRAEKEGSISLVATFGSIAREELTETSDLDVRVVRRSGFSNGIKACFFVLNERSRAFFKHFPLDIYLLDDEGKISELGEYPVIIYEKQK